MISLPSDVESTGYKQVSQFQFKQVFKSKSKEFEGTEKEFVKAGHGYEYINIPGPNGIFRRLVI